MSKMSDLLNLDVLALEKRLGDLRKEVFDWKLQKVTSGLEKPHLMKIAKKDIARVKTVLNTKERVINGN